MNTRYIVVLVTAKDKKEAGKIAKGLLEAKLIACANIVEGVQSLFWWQGKIDSSKEVLLILKTEKYFIDIATVDASKKGDDFSAIINGKVFVR